VREVGIRLPDTGAVGSCVELNALRCNRAFLRGVAQLGGFLARKSDRDPGWQTLWKGWSVLMTLVEGYELAQTIASAK